jgi:TonB family protein
MFRFTINRALVFAATCSVAAHGSFVLISGDLARQSTTPRIDRDGGTQASELVQIAGILSAEITETTQPEHLKPVQTERPELQDKSIEKLQAEAKTNAPASAPTDQATIERDNEPPLDRSAESPSLKPSNEVFERVASTNAIQYTVVPEGQVSNVIPNGKSTNLQTPETNLVRTDADTVPTSTPITEKIKSDPVIERANLRPVHSARPQREISAPLDTAEQVARVIHNLEPVIDPMSIKVPSRGNAKDTAVSNANTGEKQLPRISKNQDPKYPSLLLAKGIGGVVRLRVLVNQNGLVDQLSVDRSSGHKSFDDAAIQAVRVWEFDPAVEEGKTVSMEIIVPIRFKPVK